jgi:hypothetical protein
MELFALAGVTDLADTKELAIVPNIASGVITHKVHTTKGQ